MEPSLIILHFPVSRSKFYTKAINLAKRFDQFEKGKENIVSMTMSEIFEKWEYFNILFWRVLDWTNTVLEYEGVRYRAHTDKTRIFYALQMAHDSHICYMEGRIRQLPRVHRGEIKMDEIDTEIYSEDDINNLIDYYKIVKSKFDVKENEY